MRKAPCKLMIGFLIVVFLFCITNLLDHFYIYPSSPNKKYAINIKTFGWRNSEYSIYLSRWYSLRRKVLYVETKDSTAGIGPEIPRTGLIWASDESKVALILDGWLVDFNDLENNTRDSFNGLFLFTDKNALTEYQCKIKGRLGPNIVKQKLYLKEGT